MKKSRLKNLNDYLALMVRPTIVTIVPLALLLFHLDAVYGRRPLRAGEAAIVTAQFSDSSDLRMASPSLVGSGIAVETPALRFPEERRVCWRVRAGSSESSTVMLSFANSSVMKRVQAGSRAVYLSERKVSSPLAWLCYPGEERISGAVIRSIEVEYPAAEIGIFGFGMHWLVWFCIVSLVAMVVLRGRFRVTF